MKSLKVKLLYIYLYLRIKKRSDILKETIPIKFCNLRLFKHLCFLPKFLL